MGIKKSKTYTAPLILLISFLFYCNFLLQRMELFLTEKLGGFPFGYLLLSLFFVLFIFIKITIRQRRISLDKRIMGFIFFVFVLAFFQTSFAFLQFENTESKGIWFQLLSVVYIYFPMLTSVFVYLAVNNEKQIHALVNIIIFIVILQSIIGISMLILHEYLVSLMGWSINTQSVGIRIYSPLIGGTGPLAFILQLATPLIYAVYIIRNKTKLLLMVFSAIFVALIFTYSRGPIVITVLIILAMSVYTQFRYGMKFFPKIILLFVVSLVAVGFVIFQISVENEAYLFRHNKAHADSNRYESFKTAISLINKSPIVGSGSGQLYVRAYEQDEGKEFVLSEGYTLKTPHSFYLFIAAENGLFMLVLWVFFIAYILKAVLVNKFCNSGDKIVELAFLFSILSGFIFSLISDTLAVQYRITPMFWSIVGLGMVHAKISGRKKFSKSILVLERK